MSEEREISVNLKDGTSYTICVAKGALASIGERIAKLKPCKTAMIVSDETVGPVYATLVKKRLEEAGYEVYDALVPSGETSKSVEIASELWQELAQRQLCRDDLLVAVGGGVVGDLAGFVAATYMRGIDFVQVPTTLLAMVDASIGGKTGVDLPCGKNLVGSFHQPIYTCADTRCLRTLTDEDWANGFGEIAKSSVVCPQRSFYEWLRDHAEDLCAHDDQALEEVVARTAEFKAKVVEQDATESSGIRECLNYGHTLAHAIEAAAGYGEIGHGRAVAEGMRFAARLAVQVLETDTDFVAKQDALLDSLGLEELAWTCTPDRLLKLMKGDKKARGGTLRFVLPHDFTSWELVAVDDELLMVHLNAWCEAKQKLVEAA